LITQFATFLSSQGKQAATIESYCRDADSFCTYLQRCSLVFSNLEPRTLQFYQEELQSARQEKPNSIRRSTIGIRQFFRFLHCEKIIASSPFDQVPIPPRQEDLPPTLLAEEIDLLLTFAQEKSPSPKAERDAAICALLAYEGVKASELTQLRWRDYHSDSMLPSLRLTSLSTQRSPRVITLQRITALYLNRYQEAFQAWEHPFKDSPRNIHMMFIGFKGRHQLSPLPYLTRHGLKFMLYELGAKLAIANLNAEHLRHFAINFMLSQGTSAEHIMQHLGLRRLGNIAKYKANLSYGALT
jgi:site-specific recombinase XerD